jgi:hypothetical protein
MLKGISARKLFSLHQVARKKGSRSLKYDQT